MDFLRLGKRARLVVVIGSLLLWTVAVPAAVGAPEKACRGGAASGGDWRMTGGDAAGTRNQAAEKSLGPAEAMGLHAVWATHVSDGGSTGSLNSTPTVANGCVFVASAGGDVVALATTTGTVQWRTHYDVVSAGLGGTFVSAAVVDDGLVYALVNETANGTRGPYAVALDEHTGKERWRSAPMEVHPGSYTNASPAVLETAAGKVVFAGWSPAEGDSAGQGGFVLLDATTGALVKKTTTIPPADQARGYAGGGIWAPPVHDKTTGYAYVGASNPYSKRVEHEYTNGVLKIDLRDPAAATFGEIVGSYKGAPDQYMEELQALSQSPACEVSDTPSIAYPLDDPVCGQLDLDFGAPANLFSVGGRRLVGALQKAGIYHVFDAGTMELVWTAVVGAPCHACNAAATAVGPDGVAGVSAPGGTAFTLDAATGTIRWASPVADGLHYQGVSVADGVVYTTDNAGFFHAMNAASGVPIVRRPMALDTGKPMAAFSSAGIAVARHTVFVAATEVSSSLQSGWVIAYRA